MVAVAHRMPGAHPSQRALEPSEHGSRGQRRVQSEVRAAQNLASLYSRSDEGETIYILEPQSGSAQWSWMLRFGCAGTGHAVWCDGSRMQCGVHAMVKRMGVRAMAGRERTRSWGLTVLLFQRTSVCAGEQPRGSEGATPSEPRHERRGSHRLPSPLRSVTAKRPSAGDHNCRVMVSV